MSDVVDRITARLDAMERIGGLIQLSSLGSDGEVETLRIARGLRAIVALHVPSQHASEFCEICGDPYSWDQTPPEPWPCPTLLAIAAMFPADPTEATP